MQVDLLTLLSTPVIHHMLNWIFHYFTRGPWCENWLPSMAQHVWATYRRSHFQDIYAMTCSVYDLAEPCKVGEVSWNSAGACANTIFFPFSSGTPMPVAGVWLENRRPSWGDTHNPLIEPLKARFQFKCCWVHGTQVTLTPILNLVHLLPTEQSILCLPLGCPLFSLVPLVQRYRASSDAKCIYGRWWASLERMKQGSPQRSLHW